MEKDILERDMILMEMKILKLNMEKGLEKNIFWIKYHLKENI